jgi:soluble lytic murein transglycosylase-like protein
MHNIRPDLVRAVVQVESAFNPYAVSPKGAQGLMQLMPATQRTLGVTNPFNPFENIRAGVRYLRQLLDRYNNDEALALAAYNAGPTAVAKYGERVPPYQETRNYVFKVNQLAGPKAPPPTQIFRGADVTPDGRVIPKYTDKKPQ